MGAAPPAPPAACAWADRSCSRPVPLATSWATWSHSGCCCPPMAAGSKPPRCHAQNASAAGGDGGPPPGGASPQPAQGPPPPTPTPTAPQPGGATALRAWSLPMSAAPALQPAAQLIGVGPLTPQTVLGQGGLLDIRPDRPASVAPSAPIARRLQRWLLALAGPLAAWMGWWAWRHRRESRRLPFARAWRRLRQLDPDQSEAWLCLHQALNETAATVLRAPALPGLLARAPHLQPLHA